MLSAAYVQTSSMYKQILSINKEKFMVFNRKWQYSRTPPANKHSIDLSDRNASSMYFNRHIDTNLASNVVYAMIEWGYWPNPFPSDYSYGLPVMANARALASVIPCT